MERLVKGILLSHTCQDHSVTKTLNYYFNLSKHGCMHGWSDLEVLKVLETALNSTVLES